MEITRERVLAARTVAVVADALQLGLMPLFAPGAFSILDDVLDLVVGATLIGLVGWHWAFLPAFLAELVPAVDLAPTWTIAVFVATRNPGGTGSTAARRTEAEVLPPRQLPPREP